jgi:hypothetical protein
MILILAQVLSSCARYEGVSDCKFYPSMDDELIDDVNISINAPEVHSKLHPPNQNPFASQVQMIMGSQGVTECRFTGL